MTFFVDSYWLTAHHAGTASELRFDDLSWLLCFSPKIFCKQTSGDVFQAMRECLVLSGAFDNSGQKLCNLNRGLARSLNKRTQGWEHSLIPSFAGAQFPRARETPFTNLQRNNRSSLAELNSAIKAGRSSWLWLILSTGAKCCQWPHVTTLWRSVSRSCCDIPVKASLPKWSNSWAGRFEHRSNVAPLMASRFGPHGLMSVKCL